MKCPNCRSILNPVSQNEGVYSCVICHQFFTIEHLGKDYCSDCGKIYYNCLCTHEDL